MLSGFQAESLQLLCIPQNIAPSFKDLNRVLWEIKQFSSLKQILSFRFMITKYGVLFARASSPKFITIIYLKCSLGSKNCLISFEVPGHPYWALTGYTGELKLLQVLHYERVLLKFNPLFRNMDPWEDLLERRMTCFSACSICTERRRCLLIH